MKKICIRIFLLIIFIFSIFSIGIKNSFCEDTDNEIVWDTDDSSFDDDDEYAEYGRESDDDNIESPVYYDSVDIDSGTSYSLKTGDKLSWSKQSYKSYYGYNRRYYVKGRENTSDVWCLHPSRKARYSGEITVLNDQTDFTSCMYNHILQANLNNPTEEDYMVKSLAVRIVKDSNHDYKKSLSGKNSTYTKAVKSICDSLNYCNSVRNEKVTYENISCTNSGSYQETRQTVDESIVKISKISDGEIERIYDEISREETQVKSVYFKIELDNFKDIKTGKYFAITEIKGNGNPQVMLTGENPLDQDGKEKSNLNSIGIGTNVFGSLLNSGSGTVYMIVKFTTVYSPRDNYAKKECTSNLKVVFDKSLNQTGRRAECWYSGGSSRQHFVGCIYDDSNMTTQEVQIDNIKICSNSCLSEFEAPASCNGTKETKVTTFDYVEGQIHGSENINRCIIDNTDQEENAYLVEENDYCSIYCKESYTLQFPNKQYVYSGRYLNIDINISGRMDCYSSEIADVSTLQNDITSGKGNAQDLINLYEKCTKIKTNFNIDNLDINYSYNEPHDDYKCPTDRWIEKLDNNQKRYISNNINISEDVYEKVDQNYKNGSSLTQASISAGGNTYQVSTAKYAHSYAILEETTFKTPRVFYKVHPSGSVVISDEKIENADQVEGLPIGIKTPNGDYVYKINITGLGRYSDGSKGRIFGNDNTRNEDSSLNKVSLSKNRKMNNSIKDECDSTGSNQNDYYCTYTVNENACKDGNGEVHFFDIECREDETRDDCEKRICSIGSAPDTCTDKDGNVHDLDSDDVCRPDETKEQCKNRVCPNVLDTCTDKDGNVHDLDSDDVCRPGETKEQCKNRVCPNVSDTCTDENGQVHELNCYPDESVDECKKRICPNICYNCTIVCIGSCIYINDKGSSVNSNKGFQLDFRTISTNNMNPNERTLGMNWNPNNPINPIIKNKAKDTKSAIENRNIEYEKVEEYDFEATITPNVTKDIKVYNQEANGNYGNDTLTCYSYELQDSTLKDEKSCNKNGYKWDGSTCIAENVFCYSRFIDDVLVEKNSALSEETNTKRNLSRDSASSNQEYFKNFIPKQNENGDNILVNDYWTVYSYSSLDVNDDGYPDAGISSK